MTDQSPSDDLTPASGDAPVVGTPTVDAVVSLLLLALAVLLGWDSWRIGNSWASDGPQAGYFPFYLSLVMALASVFGLVKVIIRKQGERGTFVGREQFGRVLMVFVPTFIFCLATQFLGIYVASFFLVVGFMWWVGKISPQISLITGIIFTTALFMTFEIAFKVIMPKGPLEAALGF